MNKIIACLFFINCLAFSTGYKNDEKSTDIYFKNHFVPVKELNIKEYMGIWYQIYKNPVDYTFEGFGKCISTHYNLQKDGNISVFNSLINIKNEPKNISGVAYYTDGNTGGKLTVSLINARTSSAPYWIIELGPVIDNLYDYSIVTDNIGASLFVLTRNISRFYLDYDIKVKSNLEKYGFTWFYNKPIQVIHKNCNYF